MFEDFKYIVMFGAGIIFGDPLLYWFLVCLPYYSVSLERVRTCCILFSVIFLIPGMVLDTQ